MCLEREAKAERARERETLLVTSVVVVASEQASVQRETWREEGASVTRTHSR